MKINLTKHAHQEIDYVKIKAVHFNMRWNFVSNDVKLANFGMTS